MISANVVQDRRDDPVDAHRGFYNTGDLGLVYHYFGGNKNYLRFLGRNSYYKRRSRRLVLASNTQFGWIQPVQHTGRTTIPLNTCRCPSASTAAARVRSAAFPDNQAGPRDLMTGFALGRQRAALPLHGTALSASWATTSPACSSTTWAMSTRTWAASLSATSNATSPTSTTWCTPWDSASATARPWGRSGWTGLQPQSAGIQRPEGHLSGLAATIRRFEHSAARQPFSVLLLHRAGILI